MGNSRVGAKRHLYLCAALAVIAGATPALATPAIAQVRSFDLAPGDAIDVIPAFARQSGLQIVAPAGNLRGVRTPAIVGQFDARTALRRLIRNTGLTIGSDNGAVITLKTLPRTAERHVDVQLASNAPVGATPAPAPVTAPQSGGTDTGDIVVTATRQSQTASHVPISLSVYNQAALDERGIRSIEDTVRFTPGVNFSSSYGNTSNISIRGVNSDVGSGTTGIYVDDTPIQAKSFGYGNGNVYPRLFDLERVEVLRGPQGTLFGGSSEGGTIRYLTPQPGLESWSGYGRAEVSGTAHGGANYEVGAAIGGPLVKDKIGFRLSAYYRHDGGYVDREDYFTGQTLARNTNSQDAYVVRGAVTFAPSDALHITASMLWQKTALNDSNQFLQVLSDTSHDRLVSGQPLTSPDHDQFYLPALKIEYHGAGFDVISNSSYFTRNNTFDPDYSTVIPGAFAGEAYLSAFPDYRAYANLQNRYHSFVQEVRVQSSNPTARLHWVAGAYYSHLSQYANEQIIDPDFGQITEYAYGASVLDATGQSLIDNKYSYLQNFHTLDQEVAVFGDLNYELAKGLHVSVGAREAIPWYTTDFYVTGPFNFGTVQGSTHGKGHPLSPKFGINWQIDPHDMVYFTAAKGYRVGGGNVPVNSDACSADLAARGFSSAPTGYAPDSLWSYEVGAKTRPTNSLQLDVSAFHVVWNGIQRNVYLPDCGLQFTANLGSAVSNGFDLQLTQKIGRAFTLTGQLGYTNSHYSKTLTISGDSGSLPIVRAGDQLQEEPWTVVVGGQYDFEAFTRRGFLRFDYNFIGGHAITPQLDPSTSSYNAIVPPMQSYTLLSARLGFRIETIDVALFGNNLLNQHPRLASYTDGGALFLKSSTLRPRVIGLNASIKY
ncbi:TonB-dependent receptor domain-containing protein [Novosphingobium sp.]|uniref:TonB-dependent receptor domain-containing protein n=1 Tax=Novosphingobium sp. TaxID=1874826 RepID=UPI003D121F4D